MSAPKLAVCFGLAHLLLSSFLQEPPPKPDVPLKLNVCDLYGDPEKYKGEMVQFRAVVAGYPDSRLEQPTFNPRQPCAAQGYMSIGLELPQDVKPRPEFQLVEDESYQKYKKALQSPVQLEATLEGRFDVVFIWRNHKRERLSGGEGYGKKHDKDARLVLYKVSDVETRSVPRP